MIRKYCKTDKEELLKIFRLNTPDYFDTLEQKNFENYLDNYSDTYFVVEENGEIAGGGGYHFLDNGVTGRVSWDLFHPHSKGKGLGKQLVVYCIEKLRDAPELKKIIVRTSQYAYKFYQKLGFQTREFKKDFWGEGIDLYLMEMEITELL